MYSLGILTYQLLAGETPFDAPSPVGMLMKHIHSSPPHLLTQERAKHVPEAVLDEGGVQCRDRFAWREAFEACEAGPAIALREDGRARFGSERAVRMSRTLGELRVQRARS